MHVEDFNTNTPRHLASIVASGEPTTVTYYRKDYVTVAPTSLFGELVEAAGTRGQEILARYRTETEQREEARAS